jgi:hypothetical protein
VRDIIHVGDGTKNFRLSRFPGTLAEVLLREGKASGSEKGNVFVLDFF